MGGLEVAGEVDGEGLAEGDEDEADGTAEAVGGFAEGIHAGVEVEALCIDEIFAAGLDGGVAAGEAHVWEGDDGAVEFGAGACAGETQ